MTDGASADRRSATYRSAAYRYKDILAEITDLAAAERERDRALAVELRRRLVVLQARMRRAQERALLTSALVELHWDAAMDQLWNESWLSLRPRPDPDSSADPERLDEFDAQVHERAEDLRRAVGRRWFSFGNR